MTSGKRSRLYRFFDKYRIFLGTLWNVWFKKVEPDEPTEEDRQRHTRFMSDDELRKLRRSRTPDPPPKYSDADDFPMGDWSDEPPP